MSDNIDYLLSENFIEFSKNIADIYSEKKKKKEYLKQIYEKTQAEIKELDNKAKKLNSDFESWKNSFDPKSEEKN
jgi:ABC-type Zn uptake system ZnuABC Zn-binding protein ZnuA